MSTYGNETGVIKDPISRPYWTDLDNFGNLVFNEQTSNRIGILNISTESFTEYMIPSKNPNWGDCGDLQDCGIAQVFDFAIHDKKIWFTEWVENNIGVVDTSIPLPFSIDIDTKEIILKKGETAEVAVTVTPIGIVGSQDIGSPANVNYSSTSTFSDIIIKPELNNFSLSDVPTTISVEVTASEHALSGTHKILLGAYTDDIAISQFIIVTIV